MLSHPSWPSLKVWRMAARLTLLYKMANNLAIMSTMILAIPVPCSTRAMHLHAHMLVFHIPKRLYQYDTFLSRPVTDWNDLPKWLAAASSLEASKAPPMKHIDSLSLSPSLFFFLLLSYFTHICSVLAPLPRRWISPSVFLPFLSIISLSCISPLTSHHTSLFFHLQHHPSHAEHSQQVDFSSLPPETTWHVL